MSNGFYTAIVCLIVSTISADFVAAEDFKNGLSSGPYVTTDYKPQFPGLKRHELKVGVFSPVLHDRIAGITDQIFFDCSPQQRLTSIADYSQFSDYIRSAFIDQLEVVNLHATEAQVELTGELLNVSLYLDQLVGDPPNRGTWTLQLGLISSTGRNQVFSVEHSYPIRRDGNYCQDMASQFMTSIQILMKEILGSDRFYQLLQTT